MALGPMGLACNGVSCDCSVGHRRFNHGSRPFLIHIPLLEMGLQYAPIYFINPVVLKLSLVQLRTGDTTE